MTIELVHFDNARRALAQAHSLDEVKNIRDQAEALRQYIRQQGQSLEMQNQAAEIKLRAERRAGELLGETEKHPPGPDRSHDVIELPPTLRDLGITPMQSSRWQAEADVPEAVFEQYVAGTRAKGEELTSAGLRRLASDIQRQERKSNPTPLPTGLYNVIYADPPWPYDNQIESWGPTSLHYTVMNMSELCGMDIPSASDAALFLWVTNPFLRDAFELIDAWGFEYKTNIVWVKRNLKRPGSGFYVRGRHELLFICTKGSYVPDQRGREPIGSVLEADVQEHSRKPSEVYELIERIYPNSQYLELFARGVSRHGWKTWGNEVEL